MARGRKRKAGRRHPCGKLVPASVGETQREVLATVLEARQRHYGVTARQAKDDRLGTALGRVAFAGKITSDQYAAGEMYGEIMARNRAVMGLPMDQPRSVTALLINEGIFGGSAPDHDPDLVEKVTSFAHGPAGSGSRAQLGLFNGVNGDTNSDINGDIDVTINLPLNERQEWLLARVAQGDRCTFEDIVVHWQVSSRTAKRDIASLKDRGLIRYLGRHRRGYYVASRPT